MRIIGGRFRGKHLISPSDSSIRPTSDRAREALFSILQHGEPPLQGARFVDLFCGSGAIGLEAFSRGAGEVWLVDRITDLAARNRMALGGGERIRVIRQDATMLTGAPPLPFDMVFLDPPYHSGLAAPSLKSLQQGWLAPDARIVVELDAREAFEPPSGFTEQQSRRYGAARFVFLLPQGHG